MTAQIIFVDFPCKLHAAPLTLADRMEDNRLEILELETMILEVKNKYESASLIWDVFGAYGLAENIRKIHDRLNDAYFMRDCLKDEAERSA